MAGDYKSFEGSSDVFSGPAFDWFTISPSDSVDFTTPVRYIRATGAGNVVAITRGGTRTMAFAAGETRGVVATRVNSTSTTATGLEGGI